MSERYLKLLKAAEWLFLIGVSFLIVRNNSYPWALKRASDIIFLASAISLGGFLFLRRSTDFLTSRLIKAAKGIGLVMTGLAVATLAAFLTANRLVNSEGILGASRFAEGGLLLLLVGIFAHFDKNVYKKIAIAQLSTLAYLFVFIIPNRLSIDMYRFQLFENWPSNTGYYLVVSLSLIIAWLFYSLRAKPKFILYLYILGTGFLSILFWTGSRASWLGIASAVAVLLLSEFQYSKVPVTKLFLYGAVISSMAWIAFFFVLPSGNRTYIAGRAFQETKGGITGRAPQGIKVSGETASAGNQKLPPVFRDARRLYLWQEYSKRLAYAPLGLGVNYEAIRNDTGGAQGPHNTPLEMLVMGGPIGLLGFAYLFFLAFKNLLEKLKSQKDSLVWYGYLAAALTGISAAAAFDNMTTFRIMWILLGAGIFA